MFGLHRRLRGALVGHLAGFETNSVGPMARYSTWLERLGVPDQGRRFYDVHVLADAAHQHIAVDDLVGGLLESDPGMADEIVFGAQALGLVEAAFAAHLVDAWTHNRSSLRLPVRRLRDARGKPMTKIPRCDRAPISDSYPPGNSSHGSDRSEAGQRCDSRTDRVVELDTRGRRHP